MRRALDVADTVAAGDLTSRIDVTTTDETGRLLQALKSMNESLARTVGTVRSGTDAIATAAAQVASGNLGTCRPARNSRPARWNRRRRRWRS